MEAQAGKILTQHHKKESYNSVSFHWLYALLLKPDTCAYACVRTTLTSVSKVCVKIVSYWEA